MAAFLKYLTPDQKDFFDQNGLVVLEDFLNPTEIFAIRTEILKLVDAMDPNEHKGVFSTTSHKQVKKSCCCACAR